MNPNATPDDPAFGFGPEGAEPGDITASASRHVPKDSHALSLHPGVGTRPPDYRDLDYRALDYRSMDYRGINPEGEADGDDIDWAAAAWRYRYGLVLPTLVGIALAAAIFMVRPAVYRSTARLVVESDRPTVLDSNSGEVISGVPPAELLLMQLQSEQVLDFAARHPLLADAAVAMPRDELLTLLSENLVFENALQATRTDRATAFLLHFDDLDPDFAVSAVAALSAGLQEFFTIRSQSSTNELKRLITTAKDKLLPELDALEAEYQEFRESTDLTWDKTGSMINPFREKQLALLTRRLAVEDQQRELDTKLTALRQTIERDQDPLLVVEVARQLLGAEIHAVRSLLSEDRRPVDGRTVQEEDYSLASMTMERIVIARSARPS